jgi:transketolase
VLLGDGESAEGSVWEAAEAAAHDGLDSLCGITDVNGLGQSGPSIWDHDMDAYATKWRAFGWHAVVIDGHDVTAILDAFEEARRTKGQPTMILARTLKGKGISIAEGKSGWHGKAFKKGAELDGVLKELQSQLVPEEEPAQLPDGPRTQRDRSRPAAPPKKGTVGTPAYKLGDTVATREAFGTALAKLGDGDDRIVALDGDVKNSTFSEKFEEKHRDRFFQNFIAEQVMIGSAMGLAARGAIPFPSTFAAFLSRAYDFIRMACISNVNIKVAGSHAGVSIGEDGPSQMALEDLAMMRAQPNMTVLYPCDAMSTERLIELMAYHPGPAYMRTSRPKTPVIYGPDETFAIGGSRFCARAPGHGDGDRRRRHRIRGAQGVRSAAEDRHEHPRDRSVFAPADRLASLLRCARETKRIITVEDHYAAAVSATRSRPRGRRRLLPSSVCASARFRAAARPNNSSITTASRHVISSQALPRRARLTRRRMSFMSEQPNRRDFLKTWAPSAQAALRPRSAWNRRLTRKRPGQRRGRRRRRRSRTRTRFSPRPKPRLSRPPSIG